MVSDTIRQLLEAGVHFGHQAKKFNPKMKKFIFGKRSGIYIIDLEKTVKYLEEASKFAKEKASTGNNFLFVATKKQLRDLIKVSAERVGMYYVNERWVGGLLTNFQTIRMRLRNLNNLLKEQEETDFNSHTKKERAKILKKMDKMKKYYMGVKDMEDIPDVIFIVDPKGEELALKEACKLSIPIIALIDTNGDPDVIDYPIPGNDDAMKSTKCITEFVVKAIEEGKEIYKSRGPLKKSESTDSDEGKVAVEEDDQDSQEDQAAEDTAEDTEETEPKED